MRIDLDDVGLDRGGHVLVARALAGAPAGTDLEVVGRHPLLGLHLGTWCRAHGHGYEIRASEVETVMLVRRGPHDGARWDRATRAGRATPLGLTAQPPAEDEARHVAFGQAHLEHRLATEPDLRASLRRAIERRHDSLRDTAGLNERVLDALVVLAAGSWDPHAIGLGYDRVAQLQEDMSEGRRRRLGRLGFPAGDAAELAALHTRNFM